MVSCSVVSGKESVMDIEWSDIVSLILALAVVGLLMAYALSF